MRVPSYHHDNEARENASLTPLIDVVFLLLIFFVCASVGQIKESLLPTQFGAGALESADPPEPEERPFGEVWLFLKLTDGDQTVIQVNEGGTVYDDVGELTATLNSLAEQVRDIPVFLNIEPDVPLDDWIQVFDACRAADFESINFAINDSTGMQSKP